MDDLTEFYLMAATLIYIKSRMLLPVDPALDDEIDDPRRELIEKLIEYQKFKRLSELMERKEMEVEWSVERKKIQRPLPFRRREGPMGRDRRLGPPAILFVPGDQPLLRADHGSVRRSLDQ